MTPLRRAVVGASLAMLVSIATPLSAQMPPFAGGQGQGGQMPDPKQISGVPLPVADVPVGTVTVRVIRGALTNALPGQTVTLDGAGAKRTAKTDDSGRATFPDLPIGSHVRAAVTVDGETIESHDFDIPSAGGIRLMLVASDAALEEKAAADRQLAAGPAVDGIVVLGDQSRFVIEIGDDALNVFNIVQILNTLKRPVKTAPLVFDLPPGEVGAGMLDGSSPSAALAGKRVIVTGPFAPGTTMVQFAYSIPLGPRAITIEQRLPAQLTALMVIAQNAGGMQLASPQLAGTRDMSAQGQSFIVGQGEGIAAGSVVSLTLAGLPHRAAWPKQVTLGLAGMILLGGAWLAVRAPRPVQQPLA